MDSAMRGGMWSEWAASRTGQRSDTASQHPFGGWQGGHHPRWQYPPPQSEMITPAIGDGRPTWPPDVTAKPSRTEGSTGFRVTSGDLGTHAIHPPRKRSFDINKWQNRIESTGGRGSPPLRGDFVIRPSTIKRLNRTTRCIHPASALLTSTKGKTVSKRAGGHGGPPLRGGFVRWYVTANLETEFSKHPARLAHTRCIHPASALFTSINGKTVSKRAGGHK